MEEEKRTRDVRKTVRFEEDQYAALLDLGRRLPAERRTGPPDRFSQAVRYAVQRGLGEDPLKNAMYDAGVIRLGLWMAELPEEIRVNVHEIGEALKLFYGKRRARDGSLLLQGGTVRNSFVPLDTEGTTRSGPGALKQKRRKAGKE